MTSLGYAMSDADLLTVPVSDPGESAWEAQPEQPLEWKIEAKGRTRSAELIFTQEPPCWAKEALTDLIELLDLPEGWNSYKAQRVDEETVKRAVDVLFDSSDQVTPRPAIVPTSQGGAQIEWHAKHDIEIDVRPNGVVSLLFDDDEHEFASWLQALPIIRKQVHDAFR